MKDWRIYCEFSRPFTLLMPGVGMICGGLAAWGAQPRFVSSWTHSPWRVAWNVVLGAVMAVVLNAGSNGLNQMFDLPIDRINKPQRPLPSGRLRSREAAGFTLGAFVVGLLLAWVINYQCLLLAVLAGIFTVSYSVPPFRTKRWGILANITMAVPRGFLLPVAGWSTVKTIWVVEPWLLSSVLGLFILGAGTTKDFSDMEGDRAGGCKTLPVLYGVRKAALLISPFFVFPFLLWAILVRLGKLTGHPAGIYTLSFSLPLIGAYIDYRILRNPDELSASENHVSWKLIYLMSIVAYAGIAVSYLLPRP